jgi:hypothetical protein
MGAAAPRESRVSRDVLTLVFSCPLASCPHRVALQIRQLPPAKSEHAAICRAALIKITERVLSRRK